MVKIKFFPNYAIIDEKEISQDNQLIVQMIELCNAIFIHEL